jgi:hypothetical protein
MFVMFQASLLTVFHLLLAVQPSICSLIRQCSASLVCPSYAKRETLEGVQIETLDLGPCNHVIHAPLARYPP